MDHICHVMDLSCYVSPKVSCPARYNKKAIEAYWEECEVQKSKKSLP